MTIKKNLPIKLALIFLVMILSLHCSKKEKKISFTIKVITEYGSDNSNDKSFIGLTADFSIDSTGNVYVLDKTSKTIKKYLSDGSYSGEYGFGEGEGPGEFLNPISFELDDSGNIYVLDINKRNITVLNNENKVKVISRLPFWPAQLVVTKLGEIYTIGFPFTYTGNLIYKYTIEEDALVLKTTFCSRQDSKKRYEIEHTGNSGRLIKGINDELVFSFAYPYEIRKFNIKGEYISNMTREVSFFETPYFKKKNIIETTGGTCGLVYLNNNILVNVIYKNDDNSMEYFFDFIDYKNMKYLGTVSTKEFGLKTIRHIESDRKGHIYFSIEDPYPKVVKAEFKIEGL